MEGQKDEPSPLRSAYLVLLEFTTTRDRDGTIRWACLENRRHIWTRVEAEAGTGIEDLGRSEEIKPINSTWNPNSVMNSSAGVETTDLSIRGSAEGICNRKGQGRSSRRVRMVAAS